MTWNAVHGGEKMVAFPSDRLYFFCDVQSKFITWERLLAMTWKKTWRRNEIINNGRIGLLAKHNKIAGRCFVATGIDNYKFIVIPNCLVVWLSSLVLSCLVEAKKSPGVKFCEVSKPTYFSLSMLISSHIKNTFLSLC